MAIPDSTRNIQAAGCNRLRLLPFVAQQNDPGADHEDHDGADEGGKIGIDASHAEFAEQRGQVGEKCRAKSKKVPKRESVSLFVLRKVIQMAVDTTRSFAIENGNFI